MYKEIPTSIMNKWCEFMHKILETPNEEHKTPDEINLL